MGFAIAALCVLSLLQCALAVPRPEFALDAPVPGKSRVSIAISDANAVVTQIKASLTNFVVHSDKPVLPAVLKVTRNVAEQFQPLAEAIVTSINSLALDAGGNVDNIYGIALTAVENAIIFTDNTLPELTSNLLLLIGNPLIDKFKDSFQHIGKALQALNVILTDLKQAAKDAITAADGSITVSPDIVSKKLTRAKITELVSALRLLRGTVPVLKYTIDSTLAGITIADQYLINLGTTVDMTLGGSSPIAANLDVIIQSIDGVFNTAKFNTNTGLTNLLTNYDALTKLVTAPSAGALSITLGKLSTNVDELTNISPTVLQVLNGLKDALSDYFDLAGSLYFINQSPLVDALITTLVANDKYSQYCFYKYRDLLFLMLTDIEIGAGECFDKEIARLTYYKRTVLLMLELLNFDYEDISETLSICNGISNAANLEECIAALNTIYTGLEKAFSDKLDLIYNSLRHEIIATNNRVKICLRLSLSDVRDISIPSVLDHINECAEFGPLAPSD